MKRFTLPAVVTAVVLLLGGAYAFYARTHSPGAAKATEHFYRMWTDSSIHPLVERSYRGSPYLTREMQRRLDRLGRAFERNGFDPVVCGKEVPEDFSVSFAKGDALRPTLRVVMVAADGSPQEPRVTVAKQSDGTWLVDDIVCPADLPTVSEAEAHLRAHITALSATKAVLGGTFQVTKILWENPSTAVVSYEDGHIAQTARAVVAKEDGEVIVKSFVILGDN